jgi:hypothetical protein
VGRLVAVILAVLAVGAPADAADPVAELTLSGPRATRFNHPVDLVGRLTPVAPGGRVQLFRGRAFVAATPLRSNGTYRFHVRLGRPGPFHTVWQGTSSAPIVVRIHPLLDTRVSGARVAGTSLRFSARLRPVGAGRLHVRVVRDGRQTFARTYRGEARVRVGAPSRARVRIIAESLALPGYAPVSRDVELAIRAPTLELGSSGSVVTGLLDRLRALGYVTPARRAVFDEDVLQSVYAFQKAQGLPRTGVADAAFWQRLESPRAVLPRYRLPADHLEVDKGRQILLVVRRGRVILIVPVSTAGISGYSTPEGRFAISRKVPGYDPSPLGVLYKPMYFYGGYAIHGNPSVPPYPASHGCVRVPNFAIERLFVSEPYGEAVFVYSP